jgi:hypothetical protein
MYFQSVPSQITNTVTTPEVAFTGDTMSDFILDPDNVDVLKAKILVVEVLLLPLSQCITNFHFINSSKAASVFKY